MFRGACIRRIMILGTELLQRGKYYANVHVAAIIWRRILS
jgi:hypothetical protein